MLDIFNKKKVEELSKEIDFLKSRLKQDEELADIKAMELLGMPYDFASAYNDGTLEHPLSKLTKEERDNAIAELENIYHNKYFKSILNHLINTFGNYAIRSNEPNVGRFSINGVTKVIRELEDAHAEFVENHKSIDYDEHEIINEVMNK